MSYYLIVSDDPEFMKIEGPYRNKDDLIDALATKIEFNVFDTKTKAREYLEQ